MRAAKEHSTASAWKVTVKDSKRYRPDEHELFKGRDGSVVYADVYRVTPDCPEELLTPETLRHGFKSSAHVSKFETTTLPINEHRVKRHEMSMKINAMRSRSRKKKYADNPIPLLRPTASKEERAIFRAQLSDFSVSFADLSQLVPFGFKGEGLLEMLWQDRVPVIRASWLIKVAYLNIFGEKAKHIRGRNSRSTNDRKLKCRDEWTEQLKGFLGKLVQGASSSFVGAHDSASRVEIVEKWQYFRRLIGWQYEQGLLSRVKLLHWLIQQLEQCCGSGGGGSSNSDHSLVAASLWLPFVTQFLNDIQLSRLHVHKLYHVCCRLREQTKIGRATQHESKTRICGTVEKILVYLENVVPLCRDWSGQASLSTSVPPSSALQSGFNLPRFILLLDQFDECSQNPALVCALQACIESSSSLKDEAILALLKWSITVLRSHSPLRILIALFIINELKQNPCHRKSIRKLILRFLFDYTPSCNYEFRQTYVLYGELSRSEMFSYEEYIRSLVCRGMLDDILVQDNPSIHRRHVENIPLFKKSDALETQRRNYLYDFGSTFDQDLRRRFLGSVFRHLNAISGSSLLEFVGSVSSEAMHCASSEYSEWNDVDQYRFRELFQHVHSSQPERSDFLGILLAAPYFHALPTIELAVDALKLMLKSEWAEHRLLYYERTLSTVVSALELLGMHRQLCSLVLFVLANVARMERYILVLLRRLHHVFVCTMQVDVVRTTLADVMRRNFDSLQAAEIWLSNARLHPSVFRSLSEQLVQLFAGRYQQNTFEPAHVDGNVVRRKLADVMQLLNEEEKLYEQARQTLHRIAVDNESIALLSSLIMDSALKFLLSSFSVSKSHDLLAKHIFLLREMSAASDRLGDQRVSCHTLALSHYVDKLIESGINPKFSAFVVLLVNNAVLHLDSLVEHAVVKPIKSALDLIRTRRFNEQAEQAALAATAICAAMFGISESSSDEKVSPNGQTASKNSFIDSFRQHRFELSQNLYAESFETIFALIPLLYDLVRSSNSLSPSASPSAASPIPPPSASSTSSNSSSSALVAAAASTLDSVLRNPSFARFCLRNPRDLYLQLSSLTSLNTRSLYDRLCSSAKAVGDGSTLDSIVEAGEDDTDVDQARVLHVLSSITPWTLQRGWVALKLSLTALKQKKSEVEESIARVLLSSNENVKMPFSPELSVEIMKTLGSSIGRHILSNVQSALQKDSEALWSTSNAPEREKTLRSTPERKKRRTSRVEEAAVAVDGREMWLKSAAVVVEALAEALPSQDCVPFVSSLSEQVQRVATVMSSPDSEAQRALICSSPNQCQRTQEYVLRRVRCLRRLGKIIAEQASACGLKELVRALLALLGSPLMQVSWRDALPSHSGETPVRMSALEPFDELLELFEALVDQVRFAAAKKDEDLVVQLDREFIMMSMPARYRRRVQRTLPTFSGAIWESYRPSGTGFSTTPGVSRSLSVNPESSAMAVSTPTNGGTGNNLAPSGLLVNQGSSSALLSAVNTPTGASSSSGAPVAKRRRTVSRRELQTIEPWTVLQGVAGTPLVQKLLEISSIVSRDGSSVGALTS